MKYKHDYLNAISWAGGHKDELMKRLQDHDDDKEVRRLMRVQMNFIHAILPLLVQAEQTAIMDSFD